MIAAMRSITLAFLLLSVAAPVAAQTLQQRTETQFAAASAGTRFGLVVADLDGREIVAINPDARFIPASNTKMFTTAAAYMTMADINRPDTAAGTTIGLRGKDVVLTGFGDARMSSAGLCVTDCLATLADAVAAKTRTVQHVIGDASLWPDQRWSPGMSWNNVAERSGTGIAALSVDSNEMVLTVSSSSPGMPPVMGLSSDYFTIDNRAMTIASGPTTIDVKRLPFERRVIVFGEIAVGSPTDKIALGIDDPAHYASWRLAALLKERGVRVKGEVRSQYNDGPLSPGKRDTPILLARLTPPPLAEDIKAINKVSQNLHVDMLLRRLGGGSDGGLAVIETMLNKAGVARTAYDFADGSGMSTYNRVAPRGMVGFLRWAAGQPWGAAWRASLPIGGVDGTLANRFKGGVLEGRIFAKTGTLNASAALSGHMVAKSGRTLLFSIFANDMPAGTRAQPIMDAALVTIAAAN